MQRCLADTLHLCRTSIRIHAVQKYLLPNAPLILCKILGAGVLIRVFLALVSMHLVVLVQESQAVCKTTAVLVCVCSAPVSTFHTVKLLFLGNSLFLSFSAVVTSDGSYTPLNEGKTEYTLRPDSHFASKTAGKTWSAPLSLFK